jgi:hypothetical protein
MDAKVEQKLSSELVLPELTVSSNVTSTLTPASSVARLAHFDDTYDTKEELGKLVTFKTR